MNKKIILSLLLVLLVAVSVSAVAAADDAIAADDDAIAVDDDVASEPVKETNILKDDETTDADAIQALIDSASEGDTITLENKTYDVGNTTFTFDKQVTVKGTDTIIKGSGAGQGGNGALFIATVAGTGFEGITFINTDGAKTYGEEISGYAIQMAIANGTVDNCSFINWASGVYGRGATYCTINDCYFNGSTQSATGTGDKEKGTKAINLMGCNHITITDCVFEGQVLDAISIASNSGYNTITGNTFIDNVYAIYFGGASTEGCVISNNSFINCGYSEDAEGNILSNSFSLLSTKKSASGYQLTNNYFYMDKGLVIIEAESGDTHHGYPSAIGDINITGNVVEVADDANPYAVTFVRIISNSGELSPYAPINISGNTIDAGVTAVTVWLKDWGENDGNSTVIPAADAAKTYISVKEVATADGTVTVELDDVNGDPQDGATLSYSINGGDEVNVTTDEDGIATIPVSEDGVIAIAFAGTSTLAASSTTVDYYSTAKEKTVTVLHVANMTTTAFNYNVDGRIGEWFNITLTDEDGNPLADKLIFIGFNGAIYNRTTDENGFAHLQVNLGVKGGYTFAVSFLGDNSCNASFAVAKITVNKQTPKLTAAKTTYKASAKTKTIKATFKTAAGTAISGKKISFTVNGKTYTAKTDSNGVAKVTVSISKKGTYKFTAKYAGDDTYAAVSVSKNLVLS